MEGIEIIKNNPILQKAFNFIIKNSSSNYMPYHNLNHLLTVLKYSEYIAKGEGIYFDRRIPLHLGALFHDVDHLGGKQKSDDENITRAIEAFTRFVEYSKCVTLDVAEKTILIIEATRFPYKEPHSSIEDKLKMIIRDADLMQQFEYNWIGQTTLGLAMEAGMSIEEFVPKQRLFLEEMKFLTKTARKFKEKNWSQIMEEFRILEVSLEL